MIAAGMGNQEIANAVGVTRQAIAEKFGSDKNRCAIGSFAMLAAAVVKS